MLKNIFIGIDGGGTKCKVVVEDEEGRLLGQGKGGASNIRLSVEKTWDSVFEGLNQALTQAKISIHDKSYLFHVGLGLAGTEIPSAVDGFLNKAHPFETIILKSDAYTACFGAHDGADGNIIIVGTGVIGYHIKKDEHFQVNGWGFPHGDEGGGAWLGLEAVRATLQWRDGRRAETPLLKSIYKKFDNNLTDLVVWANAAASTQFAEIAPLVIEHIDEKDHLALSLIQQAADEISKIGRVLYKERDGLPLSLFGGIAPFIAGGLEEKLKERIVERKYDATKGAILMVRKHLMEKSK